MINNNIYFYKKIVNCDYVMINYYSILWKIQNIILIFSQIIKIMILNIDGLINYMHMH